MRSCMRSDLHMLTTMLLLLAHQRLLMHTLQLRECSLTRLRCDGARTNIYSREVIRPQHGKSHNKLTMNA